MDTTQIDETYAAPQMGHREYLLIIYRRRWVFLATFVVIFAIAAIRVMMLTPIFRSTAKILVETKIPREDTDVLEPSPITGARKLETQIEVIKSGDVMQEAMRSLPDLTPGRMPAVRVDAVKGTDVIAIVCESPDSQLAADAANSIADAYVAQTLAANQDAAGKGLEFVNTQLEAATRALEAKEAELEIFREGAGPGAGSGDGNLAGRLQTMTDNARTLRAAVAADRATVAKLRAENARKRPKVETSESVVRNPRIDSLRSQIGDLEAQRTAALLEYAPTSQRVTTLERQMRELRAQMDKEAAELVPGRSSVDPLGTGIVAQLVQAEVQLAANEKRAAVAEEALAEAQDDFAALPANQRRLTELERDRNLLERRYVMLAEKKQELLLAKESEVPGAYVVQRAVKSLYHVVPNRTKSMAVALAFGLFVAVLVALLVEYMDDTFVGAADAERALRVPALATIPRAGPGESVMLDSPMGLSASAEAYRQLRSSLHPSALGRQVRAVVVTAAGPEEGTTTVATNLSIAYAEGGQRTVLVDADLRDGGLHEAFQLPPDGGLADCLTGGTDPARALRPTAYPNLSVLPAGAMPANPAELLGSRRMEELLTQLLGMAEVVVFDSSPALLFADIRVVARLVDAVVIPIDLDNSKHEPSKQLVALLEREGAQIAGVVVSKGRATQAGGYLAQGEEAPSGDEDQPSEGA